MSHRQNLPHRPDRMTLMTRLSGLRRRRVSLLLAGAIALVLVICSGLQPAPVRADVPRHYDELEFPTLREIQLPDYTRVQLDNGLVAYLVEDHELPLVSGSAMLRIGSRVEPAESVGLASIVGEVIRSGGSQSHPGDVLNELLEQRAALIESGMDTVSGISGFGSLTEDLDEVFSLFAEVLREPAFPQDKIDLSKTRWRGSIARRNDQPSGILSREFGKLIYGADSPYARTVEYSTLDRIDRDALVAFHRQYYRPDTTLLGIVGDFDTAEMRSRLEAAFGDWQPDTTLPPPDLTLPEVSQASAGGMYFIDRPQLTQSYIQMGHLGGKLSDPDYTALSVLNQVLNGFSGQLTNEVRSRQGLAYVVYGFWSPRFDYPGLFVGGGQTRSEATVDFIRAWTGEIEKVRTQPISDEALQLAKESELNSFVFNFQTPAQLMSRLMRYEYYDYPEDFIFRYQQEVEATTAEDILRAAQTHLQPQNLVTLVVGNGDAIQPPLESIAADGQVIPLELDGL